MKNLTVAASSIVLSGLLAGTALLASARAQGNADRVGTLAPWKAMSLAEQKTGGKAIVATYEFDDGRWGYSIMVVAKHKLWEVELDRNSGKVGDVESADPAGEAKEFESDLKRAMSR